jgi:hypothetical protein
MDVVAADASGRVGVPPDDPSYTLRRVWLTKEDEEGYKFAVEVVKVSDLLSQEIKGERYK